MYLHEVREILDAEVLAGEQHLGKEVTFIKASDLMSDVLTLRDSGILLLTGLANIQAVRTAEIAELSGVIFVRGKKPDAQTIELACQKNIPLLATLLPMYEACGLLYQSGLSGITGLEQRR
jgi:predicted transcriptional regulator